MDATIFNWLYHALIFTWHDPFGYNFVSGPLPNLTLLGAAYAIYRHHNCHARGCFRIARHPVEGTGYVTCRKHHPGASKSPTAEDISDAHAAAMQARAQASAG